MYMQHGVAYAVMIEPLDYPFSVLAENCKLHSNYLPVKSVVGPVDGESVKMYVASNAGQSSSILKPARHLETFPQVSFGEEVLAISYTLDTISRSVKANNHTFPESYDIIYLDVQGAELEVLKGAASSLSRAKYVFTEVGFGGGYEKDVSCLRLAEFLSAFGFNLVWLHIDPNTRYGDAFFVRDHD